MKFSDDYHTVGVANEDGKLPCVVIVLSTGTVMKLPEQAARKLADDLLRNTNYLWPLEETPDEN